MAMPFRAFLRQKGYSDRAIEEIWKWYDFSKERGYNCPQCTTRGGEIQDQDVSPYILPYEPAEGATFKTTRLPMTSGVLTITAACLNILLGVFSIVSFTSTMNRPWSSPDYWILIAGVFGFFAFAFGLEGGVMSLRRTNFVLAELGACLTLLSGVVAIPASGIIFPAGLFLAIIIITLSIPSLVIIAASKKDFS